MADSDSVGSMTVDLDLTVWSRLSQSLHGRRHHDVTQDRRIDGTRRGASLTRRRGGLISTAE